MICPLEELRKDLEKDGYTEMEWIIPSKGLCVEMNDNNNTGGQRCNIIWMPVYETATLVHELAHLVMYCLDEVGVPISRENSEGFAFYMEYWFNEIQRARRKYPDGKKPSLAKL